LWELMNMPYEHREYDEKTFWKVRRNIELYAKLLHGSKITKIVVTLAFVAITAVSFIWLATIIALRHTLTSVEFSFVLIAGMICTAINVSFSVVLLFLNKIKVVGEFPTVEQLLDADVHTDVRTLTLAGMTMRAEFSGSTAVLFFPIPFKNIRIAVKDGEKIVKLDGENFDYELSDQGYGIQVPLPYNVSREDPALPHFRLISETGVVSVHYGAGGGESSHFPEHVIEKKMKDINSYFYQLAQEKLKRKLERIAEIEKQIEKIKMEKEKMLRKSGRGS